MGTMPEDWLATRCAHSCRHLLRSISRTDLVKARPGFGQQVRAAAGSVVASPVLADWDPEPDYFFHWFRDSALVMDALRLLYEDGRVGTGALAMLADFVGFSTALQTLDGRTAEQGAIWRERVLPPFRQYLRSEAELAAVRGDAVVAETRVNADGSLDISQWARPQHDGAALRALALLRWWRHVQGDAALAGQLATLLRHDLAFVRSHWDVPAFDMWEEVRGLHYHTLATSAAALAAGARWHGDGGDAGAAQVLRDVACGIVARLDGFWRDDAGFYVAHEPCADAERMLDISVVFAAIHVGDELRGRHTAADPRVHATLDRLAAMFAAEYAINRGRGAGVAMGRYRGDAYFSGGAWYAATLAAAELCFRAARLPDAGPAAHWCGRGEAFLDTVRVFAPAGGELPEQFGQHDGTPSSARDLAWSHAAVISCLAARRAALARTGAP